MDLIFVAHALIYCPFSCTGLLLDIFQTHVSFAPLSVRISINGTGKLIDFVRNTKLSGVLSNCYSYFMQFFFQSLDAPVILLFYFFLSIFLLI